MTMTGKEHHVAMDYVRYLLAMGVVIAHFNYITGTDMWWPVSSGTAVGVFFGLSGFLVCGTYLRKANVKEYILGRAKRIIPIYFAIVILSAILLCPTSEMNTAAYFTHPDFWKYLLSNLCFLNFLQPTLPGVFCDSVTPVVNASLWTLKVEWALYFSIPMFYCMVRRWYRSPLQLIGRFYVLSVFYKVAMLYASQSTGISLFHTLSYQFMGQVTFFYAGVLLYHHLDFCRRYQSLLIISSAMLSLACQYTMSESTHWGVVMVKETLFPISIVTFFLMISIADWGKIHLPRIPNLSYELYLMHFPIIQFFANEYPNSSLMPCILLVVEVIGMLIISKLLAKGISLSLKYCRNKMR